MTRWIKTIDIWPLEKFDRKLGKNERAGGPQRDFLYGQTSPAEMIQHAEAADDAQKVFFADRLQKITDSIKTAAGWEESKSTQQGRGLTNISNREVGKGKDMESEVPIMEQYRHDLARACQALSSSYDPSIRREEVAGVPGAFVLKSFLSHAECVTLSACAESLVAADPTRDEGRAMSRRKGAHHTPCVVKAGVLNSLCARMRPHLPTHAGPTHAAKLCDEGMCEEISSFLRCYSYQPGNFSGLHFDKSLTEHSKDGFQLKLTSYSVLFYLRGKPECKGGCTVFYPDAQLPRTKSGKSVVMDQDYSADVLGVPVKVDCNEGDVLIFPHGRHTGCFPDPLHEGAVVESGIKTLIRTDIVYCNPPRGSMAKQGKPGKKAERQERRQEKKRKLEETENQGEQVQGERKGKGEAAV